MTEKLKKDMTKKCPTLNPVPNPKSYVQNQAPKCLANLRIFKSILSNFQKLLATCPKNSDNLQT